MTWEEFFDQNEEFATWIEYQYGEQDPESEVDEGQLNVWWEEYWEYAG